MGSWTQIVTVNWIWIWIEGESWMGNRIGTGTGCGSFKGFVFVLDWALALHLNVDSVLHWDSEVDFD